MTDKEPDRTHDLPSQAAGSDFVLALTADLLFAVRIREAATAAGARAEIVEDAAALQEALARWPALVLIDLSSEGWEKPVRWAKTQPHTRAIPIVAFGSHVATETLQRARAAGCDHAWARSRFVAELPQLLNRTLHPPTRWVEGWDVPPPPDLHRAVEQFNAGEYWECHETLETLWVAERRPVRDLYQGLLQVGVAFHHLQNRNYAGAIKMFRRGLPRLRDLPPVCQGVHVAELVAAARAVHDAAVALGPERIGELDLTALPRVKLTADAQEDGG
ncbi:MAG: DUF309 domain-containing protein [Anaerolineae bacterium]|nr:DUF309 domain-containing protein [Anaerolineae bacterium]